MITGPVLPRASRLSTTPPSAASGCVEANAAAPHRHASSASVSTKTMSLRGAGPGGQRPGHLQDRRRCRRRRRCRPARPAPSRSARPGTPRPVGSVPGSPGHDVADARHRRPARARRSAAPASGADGVLHGGLQAEAAQRAHQVRRGPASLAALPATCGARRHPLLHRVRPGGAEPVAGGRTARRRAGARTSSRIAAPITTERRPGGQGGEQPAGDGRAKARSAGGTGDRSGASGRHTHRRGELAVAPPPRGRTRCSPHGRLCEGNGLRHDQRVVAGVEG